MFSTSGVVFRPRTKITNEPTSLHPHAYTAIPPFRGVICSKHSFMCHPIPYAAFQTYMDTPYYGNCFRPWNGSRKRPIPNSFLLRPHVPPTCFSLNVHLCFYTVQQRNNEHTCSPQLISGFSFLFSSQVFLRFYNRNSMQDVLVTCVGVSTKNCIIYGKIETSLSRLRKKGEFIRVPKWWCHQHRTDVGLVRHSYSHLPRWRSCMHGWSRLLVL